MSQSSSDNGGLTRQETLCQLALAKKVKDHQEAKKDRIPTYQGSSFAVPGVEIAAKEGVKEAITLTEIGALMGKVEAGTVSTGGNMPVFPLATFVSRFYFHHRMTSGIKLHNLNFNVQCATFTHNSKNISVTLCSRHISDISLAAWGGI